MQTHPLHQVRTLLFVALATAVLTVAGTAFAGEVVGANKVVILSNDISNMTTPVEHRADASTPGNGGGADTGTSSADSGKSNNGHGNNADGVDSSNPGQGKGGPNADGADSDPSVDDEAGGGGAAPSKGNGKNKK